MVVSYPVGVKNQAVQEQDFKQFQAVHRSQKTQWRGVTEAGKP
jgi:hypothetical protein